MHQSVPKDWLEPSEIAIPSYPRTATLAPHGIGQELNNAGERPRRVAQESPSHEAGAAADDCHILAAAEQSVKLLRYERCHDEEAWVLQHRFRRPCIGGE
jgi:hypothetical protein